MRYLRLIAVMLLLCGSAFGANRYWVAGTGNWSDATNHWSDSSGGTPNASFSPTSVDDVIFDANSGSGTCTVNASAFMKSLTFTTANITLAGGSTITVYSGNITFYTGMSITSNSQLNWVATGATYTYTSAGTQPKFYITMSGTGATYQLADNLTLVGAGSGIALNVGTFDTTTNSTTVTFASAVGGSKVLGATGYASTLTFYNLTLTGAADTGEIMTLGANVTVTNTFTATGNSAINRLYLKTDTTVNPRTITAAAVNITNTDFRLITGAGAASWDISAGLNGDCWLNSGITFPTADNIYWTADADASDNWSDVTHWDDSDHSTPLRIPLCQDTAIFDAGSFSSNGKTVVQNMPRVAGMTFADIDQTMTFTTSTAASVMGSLILSSNVTLTASSQAYSFEGSGTYYLTSAGKTWAKNLTLYASSGTLRVTDNLSSSSTGQSLMVTSGTLDMTNGGAGNFAISFGTVTVSTGTTITLGSATHELKSTGTVWTASGTVTVFSGILKIINTTNTAITFAGGGKTYGGIWWSRGASTATNTITGTNTFTSYVDDGTGAHSTVFPNVTTTVTSFTVGTSSAVTTLTRTGASGTWTISDTTGTNTCTNCNISNSTATGGAVWNAISGSVDGGGNTGWNFGRRLLMLFGIGQ